MLTEFRDGLKSARTDVLIMNKKDYMNFIKKYTLSIIYFIAYIPRLVIAGVLVLVPFYFVSMIVFYILSAKVLNLDSLINFFDNFMISKENMSLFDQIGFYGISFSTLYFTCGNNFYGRLVKKVWPLNKNTYYE